MRICLITKYPPIEGGISSQAYWLVKALGQRGHEVFVVTNADEVERDYREQTEKSDACLASDNVHVFSTSSSPESRKSVV